MAAPVKRPWSDYPRFYLLEAERIARLAVPTLNTSFDNPPMCGPYNGRRDTNTFRAQWHRLLGALREETKMLGDLARPDPQRMHLHSLYSILDELTTRSDPRLKSDGTQEWWLEFAPSPFILSVWRNQPNVFMVAQNRHGAFMKYLDATNGDH